MSVLKLRFFPAEEKWCNKTLTTHLARKQGKVIHFIILVIKDRLGTEIDNLFNLKWLLPFLFKCKKKRFALRAAILLIFISS